MTPDWIIAEAKRREEEARDSYRRLAEYSPLIMGMKPQDEYVLHYLEQHYGNQPLTWFSNGTG